jgi:hypothetical protein
VLFEGYGQVKTCSITDHDRQDARGISSSTFDSNRSLQSL